MFDSKPGGGGLFGGGGLKAPEKLDPKLFGMLMIAGVTLVAALVGDDIAFNRAPTNPLEFACGAVTGTMYLLLGDRLYAGAAAFVVFGTLAAVVGMILWQLIERMVLEPMAMRRMVEAKRRQKDILNKIGDDTL